MLTTAKLLLRRMLFHPGLWAGVPLSGTDTKSVLPRTRRREADAFVLRNLAPELMVRTGPFAGLRYPALRAHGSVLAPKLLGTYEAELHPTWRHLATQPITCVCDIGCAEGYYAVGLARQFPTARVAAYDIDPAARQSCAAMAAANGTADRVVVHDRCDPAHLLTLPAHECGLLVMDCEGAERDLLTPRVLRHLAGWHGVVELHAPLIPGSWAMELHAHATATHHVEIIDAWSDESRVTHGSNPLFARHDPVVRRAAYAENRPDGMHWLVLRPRH